MNQRSFNLKESIVEADYPSALALLLHTILCISSDKHFWCCFFSPPTKIHFTNPHHEQEIWFGCQKTKPYIDAFLSSKATLAHIHQLPLAKKFKMKKKQHIIRCSKLMNSAGWEPSGTLKPVNVCLKLTDLC